MKASFDSGSQPALGAIRQLRRAKLAAGRPFMLGEAGLPAGQVYFEYPDGRIAVAQYPRVGAAHEVVRWLPEDEAIRLRQQLDLPLPVPES